MQNSKTILVTGGAGFIGANFLHYFLQKNPNYNVINLDKLTYAADLSSIESLIQNANYTFVHGDICDEALLDSLFAKYNFHGVIHFAAESHVDNSIKNPGEFVRTNVLGTFALLDASKKHWMDAPHKYKLQFQGARFHHISTDEVFGTLGDTGFFTETTPYAPNSPYSASKASSDMLVRSYFHTFGLDVTISNCSNNYGPFQHDEKLIPTIIRNALKGQPIPVYGNGTNIRDWLFAQDHCVAIDLIFHSGIAGETYNIGGDAEKRNIDVVHTICEVLKKLVPNSHDFKSLITYVSDRPGHDFRYAIDFSKMTNTFGWTPQESFETGLEKTIKWYIEKYK